MPRTSLFPAFLLPAMPFRRRTSSTDSTSTASTSPPCGAAPFLGHHAAYLRCARCAVDLCLTSAIDSRGFTGRWGRAYLVAAPAAANSGLPPRPGTGRELSALPNTHVHRPVPRQLVTGAHTVSDVSCAFCGSVLGWKYVAAEEDSQRYKVGKFILETKRVSVVADWEQPDPRRLPPVFPEAQATGASVEDEEDVDFDSQDEDECEDLFAGIWTPAAAARRRRSKRWEQARDG